MPFGKRKKKLGDLSLVLSQFKKYLPSGNLKFNNLGIFQSLKLRILMGKILQISLQLIFYTLGCNGLTIQGFGIFQEERSLSERGVSTKNRNVFQDF